MTDRELLEMAAKAAGIKMEWDKWSSEFICINVNGVDVDSWNPLTDDSDALRLAVKLGLTVAPANGSRGDIVEVYRNSSLMGRSSEGKAELHGNDAAAATRRAITCAAAAIGEAMP